MISPTSPYSPTHPIQYALSQQQHHDHPQHPSPYTFTHSSSYTFPRPGDDTGSAYAAHHSSNYATGLASSPGSWPPSTTAAIDPTATYGGPHHQAHHAHHHHHHHNDSSSATSPWLRSAATAQHGLGESPTAGFTSTAAYNASALGSPPLSYAGLHLSSPVSRSMSVLSTGDEGAMSGESDETVEGAGMPGRPK